MAGVRRRSVHPTPWPLRDAPPSDSAPVGGQALCALRQLCSPMPSFHSCIPGALLSVLLAACLSEAGALGLEQLGRSHPYLSGRH